MRNLCNARRIKCKVKGRLQAHTPALPFRVMKIRMLALTLALGLSACSPNVETRGYLKDPEWKSRITLGQS
jgi:hypothetical protein